MFGPLLRRLVSGLALQSAAVTFVHAQTTDDLFNEGVDVPVVDTLLLLEAAARAFSAETDLGFLATDWG